MDNAKFTQNKINSEGKMIEYNRCNQNYFKFFYHFHKGFFTKNEFEKWLNEHCNKCPFMIDFCIASQIELTKNYIDNF